MAEVLGGFIIFLMILFLTPIGWVGLIIFGIMMYLLIDKAKEK